MSIRVSKWCAWTERQNIPGINDPGVYAIARRVKRGARPDLCSKRIIYVGYTEQTLRGRLNAFDRASEGRRGHAGGSSFFGKHICQGLEGRIDCLTGESPRTWTSTEIWVRRCTARTAHR